VRNTQLAATVLSTTVFLMKVTFTIGEGRLKSKLYTEIHNQNFNDKGMTFQQTVNYQGREY